MEKWIPYTVPAVLSFVVGYLLSYWNHGLTVRREANSRRRKFRDEIRSVALRFDNLRWSNFIDTYQESVPDVRRECAKISEDVKRFHRRGFASSQEKYCGFKRSDLELDYLKIPAQMEENLKKKSEEAGGCESNPAGYVGKADKVCSLKNVRLLHFYCTH